MKIYVCLIILFQDTDFLFEQIYFSSFQHKTLSCVLYLNVVSLVSVHLITGNTQQFSAHNYFNVL